MNNDVVIRALTIYGNSLKKLYKFLPEDCIKAIPNKKEDVLEYNLEVNINGVEFTGKDDNSNIVISSYNRNYTKEELIAIQKIVSKCFTYPFGAIGFYFGLNIVRNDKTEKIIKDISKKYKIEPFLESLDSEGHIELKVSDVRDFATPSFINFILELQTLAEEK